MFLAIFPAIFPISGDLSDIPVMTECKKPRNAKNQRWREFSGDLSGDLSKNISGDDGMQKNTIFPKYKKSLIAKVNHSFFWY